MRALPFTLRLSGFAAALSLLLTGCQTGPPTPPSMSLEEAKKLTTDFHDQGFVPPPRTTADIALILEQAKPDTVALAQRRAIADAPTPSDPTAPFYYRRGQVLRYEGRLKEAIEDLSEAVRLSPFDTNYQTRLGDVLAQSGYPVEAGQVYARIKSGRGNALFATLNLSDIHAALGDYAQADRDLISARLQYAGLAQSSYSRAYRSAIEMQEGLLFKYRGDYAAAERSFRLAMDDTDWVVAHWNQAWEQLQTNSGGAQKEVNVQRSVRAKRQIADVYRRQWMLDEAEYWARRSLTQSVETLGVDAPPTISTLLLITLILADQGRYDEAQQLASIALTKARASSPRVGSTTVADLLVAIGAAAIAQAKTQEALDAFEAANREVAANPEYSQQILGLNLDYAIALRGADRIDDALRIARAAVDWRTRTLGSASPSTVLARGFVASFLAAAGEPARSLAEFQAVILQLMDLSQSASASGAIDLSRKAQGLLNDYIRLLAGMRGTSLEQQVPGGVVAESFRIADLARGGAVQQALIESGARAAISDKALADLARREQDTSYQIAARERVLADAQSLGANQQNSQALEQLHSEVAELRTARATIRAEIERRFPSYARITQPHPATLEEARSVLKGGEAIIAIYSAESESYVWVLRETGEVGFAVVSLRRDQLADMVRQLRHALDSHARTLGEIPAFDVELAYRLYAAMLMPAESRLKGTKSLIIVAHGPLAQLPFALLVTRPVAQPKEATALFSGYRDVPFLVRQVAVTQVPSVAALTILRGLPAASPDRRAFAGFGDPWFSAAQAAEARTEQIAMAQSRSFHLRAAPDTETRASANLAMLPRLPDTAIEVREVGSTLHADPARDIFLGAAANERQVRTMKLDDRRVVMFATHGLVPGDLDGLMQPALALSAPKAANVDGDGLLTMEKIMGLKLDADWVVLSACNTAAAAGAGADAISGLGRAFFYAGARSLLVTHWPVESTSARLLTTATFKAQAADASLSRADALRKSMLDLVDAEGYVDPATNKIGFSYAHPVFWAPFALVGDGR